MIKDIAIFIKDAQLYNMEVGKYEIKPFSKERRNISLLLEEGRKKHIIYVIVEADVTKAREIIKERKRKGDDISFTGWIVKCMAEIMKEEREFNAIRHGKRKLIYFEDVDAAIPVERVVAKEARPRAYIIRKANEKSIEEITKEIRNAQKEEVEKGTEVIGKLSAFEKFVLKAPYFIQKILFTIVGRNAFMRKKYMGTTGVTSIGMTGFDGWLIIIGGHYTTQIGIGGIAKKIIKDDEKVEEREFLRFIIGVDHDIIDGAPLARFASKLIDLLEMQHF